MQGKQQAAIKGKNLLRVRAIGEAAPRRPRQLLSYRNEELLAELAAPTSQRATSGKGKRDNPTRANLGLDRIGTVGIVDLRQDSLVFERNHDRNYFCVGPVSTRRACSQCSQAGGREASRRLGGHLPANFPISSTIHKLWSNRPDDGPSSGSGHGGHQPRRP